MLNLSEKSFEEALKLNAGMIVLAKCGFVNPKTGEADRKLLAECSDTKKDIMAFCMEHWEEQIVCDKVQLPLTPQHYEKKVDAAYKIPGDMKMCEVLLPDAKVEVPHFLQAMMQYELSGKFYIYKEAETRKWQKLLSADIKRREKESADADAAKATLTEGLAQMSRTTGKKTPTKITYGCAVDKELEIYQDVRSTEANEYLCFGTEEECLQFVKDEKEKREAAAEKAKKK